MKEKVQNILFSLSLIMRVALIVAIILEVQAQQWMNLFVTSLALLFMFFPAVLKRNYKITLPVEFEFIIVAFIFGSIYLGEIWSFYFRIWWWDDMLHTISAMILAIIGLLLVNLLNQDKKVSLNISPFFVSLFAFCFAFSMGALWEIVEYSTDIIFGTDMLKTSQYGIHDTFRDLIVDATAALIISTVGYFYTKKHRKSIVEKLTEKIIIKEKIN